MSDASVNGQEPTTTSNKNSPTPRPEPKSTPAQTPTPTYNPKKTPTVNQSPTHILSPTPANTPTPKPATLPTESSTPTVISALSLTPKAGTSSLSTQNPTTKSASKSTSIESPMHISTPSQSHPTPTTLPTPPPTPTSTTNPTKNPSRTSAQTTPKSIINPTSSRTPSPTTLPTASSIQSSELSTTPIQTPNQSNMPMSSLKENDIDLKKLNEARTISDHIGNSYELTPFKKIEEKTSTSQNACLDFTKSAQLAKPQISETASSIIEPKSIALEIKEEKNASIAVKCNNWEDFQAFAQKAEIISFTYRDENEKLFEANALKNNQIITYTGEIPRQDQLLKMWLSSTLVTSEKNIFQGTISKA